MMALSFLLGYLFGALAMLAITYMGFQVLK